MKLFTLLCQELEMSSAVQQNKKVFISYLKTASDQDKVWSLGLLSGRRPKRITNLKILRPWAEKVSAIPSWLFEAAYSQVGDMAETLAKVISNKSNNKSEKSLTEWIELIQDHKNVSQNELKQFVVSSWGKLSADERFVFNKIITGGFRLSLPQKLMQAALSELLDQEESSVAYKLCGDWLPGQTTFHDLLLSEDLACKICKPFLFRPLNLLEGQTQELGQASEWTATYHWSGIRVQLVFRQGELFIWNEEGELVTSQYPELQILKACGREMVLEGELVVFNSRVGSFVDIQKRARKNKPSKKALEELPVIMICTDLLEENGKDLRSKSLEQRTNSMEALITAIKVSTLSLCQQLDFNSWNELEQHRSRAREIGAGALILKARSTPYFSSRSGKQWYRWKTIPFQITAVLLYVTRSGRGINHLSQYTFALRKENAVDKKFLTFTKVQGGLSDLEVNEIAQFVKKNTVEKFGPVLSIKPELVFEISFESIVYSSIHKCGFVVKSPKIFRWNRNKTIAEINTIQKISEYILK